MSLTEQQAQRVVLVKAIEQARDNGGLWSATDAKEATRATTELVGAKTALDQFVARRAELVLETIARRRAGLAAIDPPVSRWPALAGWLLLVAALSTGFITDHFAADRRVNIVEYPLAGLVLWNLAIYLAILGRWLSGLFAAKRRPAGPLTDLLAKWRLRGAPVLPAADRLPWVDQFRSAWYSLSAALNRHRIEYVLHSAALCFALGALASLYVRGFFKEYRAGWESTFFSADSIHAIASVLLTPGALLLNMPIPDVRHVAGLRFPESAGEIASGWIHLYGGSILVWIIVPRLLLATADRIAIWRRQRSFPLPLNNAYFTTLRAVRGGSAIAVLAIPFRYELTAQVRNNLARLLERIHGLAVTISVQQPVIMGEDSADWKAALGSEQHIAVFVIFNLAATAEADAHGQVLKRILNDVDGRAPVIPIVDTGAYAERDAERFDQRCRQWRSVLDALRCTPLFLDLTAPNADDVETAMANLEKRLNAWE